MPSQFSLRSETPRKGRFSLSTAIPLVGAALLVLSWLTTEHFPPWVSWHSEALAFLAAFLLAWTGALRCWRSGAAIDVPSPVGPFLLAGIVAAVQFAGGVTTFGGDLMVFWFYVALSVACLVIGFNAASRQDAGTTAAHFRIPEVLAWALLAGALASTIVSFAQVFDLWPQSAWIARGYELRRPGANLSQPNQLATLLVMGVASAAFLHLAGRLGAWTAALVLLVLSAGLAATESRAGMVALMALLLWWQVKRPLLTSRISPWAAPGLGLVFGGVFIAWPQVLNLLQLETDAGHRFSNGDIRLAMWLQLWEAIMQRPWLGWGALEVAEALNGVAHAHSINNPFTYSHNVVIDWAVWMGLPIALLLLAAVVAWLWRRMVGVTRLEPWYCIAVVLPLTTHSMLEFPYAYAYFLAPVMVLVGFLERSAGATSGLRIRPTMACLALLPFSVLMIWSVREYLAIEEDFRMVRFEQLRIGRTPANWQKPEVVLLTQLGKLLTGSRIELRPGMPAADLDDLRKLALRYPWVATQYRYSFALALNGQQQEAARQLQVLRWQRGEKIYSAVKAEIANMAKDRYPQLRTLSLP